MFTTVSLSLSNLCSSLSLSLHCILFFVLRVSLSLSLQFILIFYLSLFPIHSHILSLSLSSFSLQIAPREVREMRNRAKALEGENADLRLQRESLSGTVEQLVMQLSVLKERVREDAAKIDSREALIRVCYRALFFLFIFFRVLSRLIPLPTKHSLSQT